MAKRNTRQELIDSGLAFIDAQGLDALTLRTLGAELGLHHTALYRHFRSKEDLLDSIFRSLLGQAFEAVPADIPDPRQRLTELCLAMRGVFESHPGLSGAIVQGAGMMEEALDIQLAAIGALREMGVPEDRLGTAYQAIESFVGGSSLYDFANAPQHAVERNERYGRLQDPALARAAASEHATIRHTEDAFRWGLDALIDAAVRP